MYYNKNLRKHLVCMFLVHKAVKKGSRNLMLVSKENLLWLAVVFPFVYFDYLSVKIDGFLKKKKKIISNMSAGLL